METWNLFYLYYWQKSMITVNLPFNGKFYTRIPTILMSGFTWVPFSFPPCLGLRKNLSP